MIKISGPSAVEVGAQVCLTVTGVGPGFSANAAVSGSQRIKLKVIHNPAKHRAKICFTIPPGARAVTVHVKNTASERMTHTVFGL